MRLSLFESAFSILLKAAGAVSLLFMNLAIVDFYDSHVAGAFFSYLALVYIVSSFLRHGTDSYTVKYLNKSSILIYPRKKNCYFHSRIFLITKLYIFFCLAFITSNQLFNFDLDFNSFYITTIYIHALIFYLSFFLQSQFFYKLSVTLNSILIPLLFILLVKISEGELNIYLLYAISCFSVFVFSCIVIKLKFKLPSFNGFQGSLNYGSYKYKLYWLVSMLNIFVQWSPVFLAGLLMSFTDNTVFTMAHRVAMVISFFLIAINGYIVPHYARLSGLTERGRLQELVSRIAVVLAFVSVPSFLVVLFLIFSNFYDFELKNNYQTFKVVVTILCSAQLVSALFGSVGYLLQMVNLVKFYILSISISLLFMFVGYSAFHIAGNLDLFNFSAITALAVIIQNVLSWLFLFKKANINTISYSRPW